MPTYDCHLRAWRQHRDELRRFLAHRCGNVAEAHVPLPDDLVAEVLPEADAVERLSQCLPRVLAELAAEDRAALVQCDLEGGAQKDYAERCGLSLAAAKSRLLRARRRLRARLAEACQLRFGEDGKICCFTPRPSATPGPSA